MVKDSKNTNYWYCGGCKQPLGVIVDENEGIMDLRGVNGQEYRVAYDYINLVCRKCGAENHIEPSSSSMERDMMTGNPVYISRRTPDGKNFFELSDYHRNLLFKELSETQKKIYGFLEGQSQKVINPENITKISKNLGLLEDKIKSDIEKIEECIESVSMTKEEIEEEITEAEMDSRIKGEG